MRIDLTKIQVGAVAAMLRDALTEDEQLYLDTLEGETDLYELTRKLLERIEEDEGEQEVLAEQIANRTLRKGRAAERVKHNREAIMALLQCAKLDKLQLPEATVSVRDTKARLVVNDPDGVPEAYTVSVPKPDTKKIGAAFTVDSDNLPNWLRVEPAKPSLTVRRK